MARVLIIGGYGVFGRRAAERLAARNGIEVIIAGRSADAAAQAAAAIAAKVRSRVEYQVLDANRLAPSDISSLGASIVIHAAGPYQGQDYRVAEASIAAGSHYIDLADARQFVTGIRTLDATAKAKGVLVVAGASSVPAIAAAVVDDMLHRLPNLETLQYGIVPGNSFDPGIATVASILGGAGRAFTTLHAGAMRRRHGWLPLHRKRLAGLGTRWLGHCDVPDLDLFPARYPTLQSQDFYGGLEVKAFHAGVAALALAVRAGALADPGRFAQPLLWLKRRLPFLGSDRGVMFIEATGRDSAGMSSRLEWTLVAREGHGPFIPSTPAVIIATKLASGCLQTRGAMPCLGLVSLDEFSREISDLAITQGFA